MKRRLREYIATLPLLLLACSGAPSAPADVDVTGTWRGRYQVVSCQSDCCAPSCSRMFTSGPPEYDFELTLVQQRSDVRGEFAELPTVNASPLSGTVDGAVAGGRLELVGSLGWQSELWPDVFGFADLLDFEGILGGGGRSITGTFVLQDRSSSGSETTRRECRILRLER